MRNTAIRGATGGRGTGGVIMAGGGSRSVVPATYVPEELVSQAQVVLQGKSRNLIIRELQVRFTLFYPIHMYTVKLRFYKLRDLMNHFPGPDC
jgi:hypothetical protein